MPGSDAVRGNSKRKLSTVFLVGVAAVPVFGMLHMPQRAAELFDFVLVSIFLALGQFEGFENFFHIIKCFAQRLDDLINLLDSTLNGRWRSGMFWRGRNRRLDALGFGGSFPLGCSFERGF